MVRAARAAGMATARAVMRVMNFIFVSERVCEDSLGVPRRKVVVEEMQKENPGAELRDILGV